MRLVALLGAFHPYIPVASLVTLAFVTPLVPKIGPVLLASAALASTVTLFAVHAWQAGAVLRHIGTSFADSSFRLCCLVIAGIVLLAAASLLWTPDAGFAAKRLIRLAITAVAALYLAAIFLPDGRVPSTRSGVVPIIALIGLAAAIACLIWSVNFLATLYRDSDAFVNRAFVTAVLAGFAVMAHVAAAPWSQRAIALWSLLAVTGLLAVTLASNSQTSVLALGCGLIAMVFCLFASQILRRIVVVLSALIAFAMPLIVALAAALPAGLMESGFLRHASAGARLRIWDSYLLMVKEKPLLGWGLEASREFDPALLPGGVTASDGFHFALHPHNAFLQVWTDLGLVGAAFTALLILILGWRIEALKPEARAPVYGLFAAILSAAAISHGAFQSWWLASVAVVIVAVLPLSASTQR